MCDKNFLMSVMPDAVFMGELTPNRGSWVIDSRKVCPGDVFVALPGAVTDGHEFIADAVKRGASMIVMDSAKRAGLDGLSDDAKRRSCFLLVSSPEEALIDVAAAWRARFSIPIVGVTGSVGKTTTKELIAAMATRAGKSCLCSTGNYNTALGAAMTLLNLRDKHDCAVLEMGISLRGEMARLAGLIRPTIGVITQIAHQHLDGLGSLQDIAAEKRAIFTHFNPDNIGIINGDQALLTGVSYAHPVVRFGYKLTNHLQARRVVSDGVRLSCIFKLYQERFSLDLSIPHRGWLMSALASAGGAHFLGVPSSCIVDVMQTMPAVRGRFVALPIKKFKGTVIDDAYNASPESMKEALLAFDKLKVSGKKVAVIGDMLALGSDSAFWHRQIGRILRRTPSIEHVILVGEQVKVIEATLPRWMQCQIVPGWEDAARLLEPCLIQEHAILVKASRGMALDRLVDRLIE